MPMYQISKRRMESYRRAEIVAQAARKQVAAGPRYTQEDLDIFVGALSDWMSVTGNLKYDEPKRRGRFWQPLKS